MDRLVDYFGGAYLINLPERLDRLKSTKAQLIRVGWDIGPGGIEIFPALRFANRAGFPSVGSRGCFYSHLECLEQAYAEGRHSVLILEDDIALSPALPRLTSSIVSRLQTLQWDFVYFGHYGTGDVPVARRNTEENELRLDLWMEGIFTTHFYGVSARILPRLIAHLRKLAYGPPGDQEAGPMPLDGAYNIFRRKNADVRCVIAHPRMGWQASFRSDIAPHLLDRWTVLRPVNSILRELTNRLTSRRYS